MQQCWRLRRRNFSFTGKIRSSSLKWTLNIRAGLCFIRRVIVSIRWCRWCSPSPVGACYPPVEDSFQLVYRCLPQNGSMWFLFWWVFFLQGLTNVMESDEQNPEKEPPQWKSCKLLIDPALTKGLYKVCRFDGQFFNIPVSILNIFNSCFIFINSLYNIRPNVNT